MTMNELPEDAIDRRAIPDAMPWRHHDSNVVDLSPSGYHPAFKDEVISQHTTAPLDTDTSVPDKTDYQKVVESGDARIMEAKEKKKGQMLRIKLLENVMVPKFLLNVLRRRKLLLSPLTCRSSLRILAHNPATPRPTILLLPSILLHRMPTMNEDNEVNSPISDQNIEITSPRADTQPSVENVNAKANRTGSGERAFASSFGGSSQNTFPGRNTDGNEGGSLRVNVALAEPFVPLWNLTTIFSLKDAEAFGARFLRTLKLDLKSANNGHVYNTDIITVDQGRCGKWGMKLTKQVVSPRCLSYNIRNSTVFSLSTRTRQRVLTFGGPRQEVVTKKNTVSKSRSTRSRITCPVNIRVGHSRETARLRTVRMVAGCCEMGGGGVVGGVGVVCGDGVDRGVGGTNIRDDCKGIEERWMVWYEGQVCAMERCKGNKGIQTCVGGCKRVVEADMIKDLEEEHAKKSVALTEFELGDAQVKKDMEKLIVDISQAEIVRFNC
nr:hypothetical protein [Tanacetum cinerariifolium]